MARKRNTKAGNDDEAGSSKQSGTKEKAPKPLKAEPKIVKKSSNPSIEKNSDKTKNVGGEGKSRKESINAQMKDQNKDKVDGMIFMCNARTKPDCMRYMVMGLPESKKDIVATIKPGLKLFLFDFDGKQLHGIFKATSAGGMELEPAAFGGSYPAQVRFKVESECLPLSENSFKKAIKAHSDGSRIKFNTELTTEQVKTLISLFQPSPILNSNANPIHPSPVPLFAPRVPLRSTIPSREALPRHGEILVRCQKEATPLQSDVVPLDPLSFGEKEYRMFGLRQRPITASSSNVSSSVTSDPYVSSSATSDPYVSFTRAPYLSKIDDDFDRQGRKMDEFEYRRPAAEQLATHTAYYRSYSYGVPKNVAEYGVKEAEVAGRVHSTHAANALSDYNRAHQQPHGRGEFESLPVSSRYSFAGPSFL